MPLGAAQRADFCESEPSIWSGAKVGAAWCARRPASSSPGGIRGRAIGSAAIRCFERRWQLCAADDPQRVPGGRRTELRSRSSAARTTRRSCCIRLCSRNMPTEEQLQRSRKLSRCSFGGASSDL